MTKQRKKSTRQYRDREMVQDCDWEYTKIKRKLRIMTTDRARYSHEARKILKKQRLVLYSVVTERLLAFLEKIISLVYAI